MQQQAQWHRKQPVVEDLPIEDIPTPACPQPVKLEYGIGCRCTATSCGDMPDPHQLLHHEREALIITSRMGGKIMEPQVVSTATAAEADVGMALEMEASKLGQKVIGFGGAVTDAVALWYQRLNSAMKDQFIRRHYGEGGAGYTLARVPMGAADFSRMDYTYNNVTGDLQHEHFCLRDDTSAKAPCGQDYKTDVLKAAQSTVAQAGSDKLKLFVSTWSPPLWYKNQNITCKKKAGMYECSPGGVESISTASKSVLDPISCEGNHLMKDCALEFQTQFGMGMGDEAANSSVSKVDLEKAESAQQKGRHDAMVAALLQRASEEPAKALEQGRDDKRRRWRRRGPGFDQQGLSTDGLDAMQKTALDKVLKEKPKFDQPHPDTTMNLFNKGFLSTNSSLQASWALYFSKFIDAYKALGVDIWGVAMQNEPSSTMPLWQGMYMTPEMQADFLVNHLGPTIRRSHPDVKIIVHDDAFTGLADVVEKVIDNRTAPFLDGVGYHWYYSVYGTYENSPAVKPSKFAPNIVGGGKYVQDTQRRLQEFGEDKFVLATEACNGYALGTNWLGPRPGEWGYGYTYSHDIMWQLINGAAGWTDWNMMLGKDGGPNLAGNFVDSPTFFESAESFIQNPSFFHLAHYSKYIVPGSRRVELTMTCSLKEAEHCQAVGFMRPDGLATVVLTNDEVTVGPIVELSGIARAFVPIPKLATGHRQPFEWTIKCGSHVVNGTAPWRSIQTIVMPCS